MIDSHCHINDDAFYNDVEGYISDAKKEGVEAFLVVGCDLKLSKRAVEISNKYPCCYAAVGIHPEDAMHAGENDLDEIEKLIGQKGVVAIG